MNTREFTYNDIFDNSNAFFEKKGSSIMVLTAKAAIEVCQEATKRNLWVLGFDGGHWLSPGFRPDGWASWSAKTDLINNNKLAENNQLAIESIQEESVDGYTAFLVTVTDKPIQ